MADFATLVLDSNTQGLMKARNHLRLVGASAKKTEGEVKGSNAAMAASYRKLAILTGGAVVAVAALAAAMATIPAGLELDAALGETSTLIEGTTAQMALLRSEADQLARQFGGNTTAQVKGFYQAISAGAGSVAEASILMQSANKLAIGGVTTSTVAVDALTTATNAYAASNLTAADASDILFVGVKAGKTTMGELGSALGQVIPIASSLDVGLDQVVASVAALTTQGQTTSMAVTGIRQVLASVIKPTKQAADEAARLGIQFDAQALKSKGLYGFLMGVIEATDGNQESMAQLFGSVEALNAVLAMAGGAGDKFSETLKMMDKRAGAADEAFEKMNGRLSTRLNVSLGKLLTVGEKIGTALLTVLVPGLEAVAFAATGVADNMEGIATVVGVLTLTRLPAMATALGSVLVSMTQAGYAAVTYASGLMSVRNAMALVGGLKGVLIAAAASTALFALSISEEKAALDASSKAKKANAAATKALREEVESLTTAQMNANAQSSSEAEKIIAHARSERARLMNEKREIQEAALRASADELAGYMAKIEEQQALLIDPKFWNELDQLQRNDQAAIQETIAAMREEYNLTVEQARQDQSGLAWRTEAILKYGQIIRDNTAKRQVLTDKEKKSLLVNRDLAKAIDGMDYSKAIAQAQEWARQHGLSLQAVLKVNGLLQNESREIGGAFDPRSDEYNSDVSKEQRVNELFREYQAEATLSSWNDIDDAVKKLTGSVGKLSDAEREAARLLKEQQDKLKSKATELHNAFEGAFVAFVTGAKSAKEAAADLLSSLAQILAHRAFETLVGGVGGSSGNFFTKLVSGTIGTNATGTSGFEGGLSMVGENGPELVEMPQGAKVHTSDATKGMMGGVTFAPVIDARGASLEAVQELKGQLNGLIMNMQQIVENAVREGQMRRTIG